MRRACAGRGGGSVLRSDRRRAEGVAVGKAAAGDADATRGRVGTAVIPALVGRSQRDRPRGDGEVLSDEADGVVAVGQGALADGVAAADVLAGGATQGTAEGIAANQPPVRAVGFHRVGQGRVGVAVDLALAAAGREGDRPLGDGQCAVGRSEVIVGRSQPRRAGKDRFGADAGGVASGAATAGGATYPRRGEALTIDEPRNGLREDGVVLTVQPGLVVRNDRQVGLVDGEAAGAVGGGEVVVGGRQGAGAAGDVVAAHDRGRRGSAAAAGAAGDAGAGGVFVVGEAGEGLREGGVGLAVEPALGVRGDGQVGLVDGEATGAVGGGEVVVGRGQGTGASGDGIDPYPGIHRRCATAGGTTGDIGTGGVLTIDEAGDRLREGWVGLAVESGLDVGCYRQVGLRNRRGQACRIGQAVVARQSAIGAVGQGIDRRCRARTSVGAVEGARSGGGHRFGADKTTQAADSDGRRRSSVVSLPGGGGPGDGQRFPGDRVAE